MVWEFSEYFDIFRGVSLWASSNLGLVSWNSILSKWLVFWTCAILDMEFVQRFRLLPGYRRLTEKWLRRLLVFYAEVSSFGLFILPFSTGSFKHRGKCTAVFQRYYVKFFNAFMLRRIDAFFVFHSRHVGKWKEFVQTFNWQEFVQLNGANLLKRLNS